MDEAGCMMDPRDICLQTMLGSLKVADNVIAVITKGCRNQPNLLCWMVGASLCFPHFCGSQATSSWKRVCSAGRMGNQA